MPEANVLGSDVRRTLPKLVVFFYYFGGSHSFYVGVRFLLAHTAHRNTLLHRSRQMHAKQQQKQPKRKLGGDGATSTTDFHSESGTRPPRHRKLKPEVSGDSSSELSIEVPTFRQAAFVCVSISMVLLQLTTVPFFPSVCARSENIYSVISDRRFRAGSGGTMTSPNYSVPLSKR